MITDLEFDRQTICCPSELQQRQNVVEFGVTSWTRNALYISRKLPLTRCVFCHLLLYDDQFTLSFSVFDEETVSCHIKHTVVVVCGVLSHCHQVFFCMDHILYVYVKYLDQLKKGSWGFSIQRDITRLAENFYKALKWSLHSFSSMFNIWCHVKLCGKTPLIKLWLSVSVRQLVMRGANWVTVIKLRQSSNLFSAFRPQILTNQTSSACVTATWCMTWHCCLFVLRDLASST